VHLNSEHKKYSNDINISCVQRAVSGTILLYRLERQPLVRTIVGSCTYDVGFCPVGSCRPSVYPSLDRTAYQVCPVYSTVTVDCGVHLVGKRCALSSAARAAKPKILPSKASSMTPLMGDFPLVLKSESYIPLVYESDIPLVYESDIPLVYERDFP